MENHRLMHARTHTHTLMIGAVSHINNTSSSEKKEISVDLHSWEDSLEKVVMGLCMEEWIR